MEQLQTFKHDPNAISDFGCTWVDWLEDGDTITASSWSSTPAGLTLASGTHDDTTTTIWISGGTLGKRHRLTNHITTLEGRQEDQSMLIVVKNR